jgi:hypothetical protein
LTVDRNAESALLKLVEIKTGKPAGFPKLAELPKLWLEIPRRKTPGKHYVAQCTAILERFVAFVQAAKRRPQNRDWSGCRQRDRTGLRRGSIRDFHSFRVTWITLALAAGVPLELVQRVTGHRTVEVVMKHYSRSGREDFRQAILKAMPKMLADNRRPSSQKEEILAILDNTAAKTWKVDSKRLRTVVATLMP